MKLEPRISIVTLGVDDLDRAVRFYEQMGLERNEKITEGVAFFQLGGMILALWPRSELAKDAGVDDDRPGFSGVAFAYNTRRAEDVAAILHRAAEAGGRVLRPAQRAFWGGVQGYFADPDRNIWEVAHNPTFPIDAEGHISLPA